ncbi:MAG: hypothetical protein ACK8QZ_01050, partial [Anaerolineales bacterium]
PHEFLSIVDKTIHHRYTLLQHLSRQRQEKRQTALRNAQLALELLDSSKRKELTFSQEFALQSLRLIERLDIEVESLRSHSRALEEEVERLSTTLQTIYSSRLWKLGIYYRRLKQFLHL